MTAERWPEADDELREGMTLVELVNRTIDRGVVLRGEVVLEVAHVELVSLSLRLMLKAVTGPSEPASTGVPPGEPPPAARDDA